MATPIRRGRGGNKSLVDDIEVQYESLEDGKKQSENPNNRNPSTVSDTPKPVAINPARSIEGYVLIVAGIHEETQEDDIIDKFGTYGTLKNIHLNLDRRTGFARGYVFLEYATHKEAERAVKDANGSELLGEKILVSFSFIEKPGSSKDGKSKNNQGNKALKNVNMNNTVSLTTSSDIKATPVVTTISEGQKIQSQLQQQMAAKLKSQKLQGQGLDNDQPGSIKTNNITMTTGPRGAAGMGYHSNSQSAYSNYGSYNRNSYYNNNGYNNNNSSYSDHHGTSGSNYNNNTSNMTGNSNSNSNSYTQQSNRNNNVSLTQNSRSDQAPTRQGGRTPRDRRTSQERDFEDLHTGNNRSSTHLKSRREVLNPRDKDHRILNSNTRENNRQSQNDSDDHEMPINESRNLRQSHRERAVRGTGGRTPGAGQRQIHDDDRDNRNFNDRRNLSMNDNQVSNQRSRRDLRDSRDNIGSGSGQLDINTRSGRNVQNDNIDTLRTQIGATRSIIKKSSGRDIDNRSRRLQQPNSTISNRNNNMNQTYNTQGSSADSDDDDDYDDDDLETDDSRSPGRPKSRARSVNMQRKGNVNTNGGMMGQSTINMNKNSMNNPSNLKLSNRDADRRLISSGNANIGNNARVLNSQQQINAKTGNTNMNRAVRDSRQVSSNVGLGTSGATHNMKNRVNSNINHKNNMPNNMNQDIDSDESDEFDDDDLDDDLDDDDIDDDLDDEDSRSPVRRKVPTGSGAATRRGTRPQSGPGGVASNNLAGTRKNNNMQSGGMTGGPSGRNSNNIAGNTNNTNSTVTRQQLQQTVRQNNNNLSKVKRIAPPPSDGEDSRDGSPSRPVMKRVRR